MLVNNVKRQWLKKPDQDIKAATCTRLRGLEGAGGARGRARHGEAASQKLSHGTFKSLNSPEEIDWARPGISLLALWKIWQAYIAPRVYAARARAAMSGKLLTRFQGAWEMEISRSGQHQAQSLTWKVAKSAGAPMHILKIVAEGMEREQPGVERRG